MKCWSSSSNAIPPAVEMARSMLAVAVRRMGTDFISAAMAAGAMEASGAPGGAVRGLLQQPRGGGRKLDRLAQDVREELLAARPRQAREFQRGRREAGARNRQVGLAVALDGIAQGRRQRVDRAAFEPGLW